jgi:hypothetical protein
LSAKHSLRVEKVKKQMKKKTNQGTTIISGKFPPLKLQKFQDGDEAWFKLTDSTYEISASFLSSL